MDEKKNILERELAMTLLETAEKKIISLSDIRLIAEEIVGDFDKISNEAELITFLEKIKQKWPFFSNLFVKYQGDTKQVEEKQVIDKLSSYIQKLN